MGNELIETILSENPALRNRSINLLVKDKALDDLLNITKELEAFRRSSTSSGSERSTARTPAF